MTLITNKLEAEENTYSPFKIPEPKKRIQKQQLKLERKALLKPMFP